MAKFRSLIFKGEKEMRMLLKYKTRNSKGKLLVGGISALALETVHQHCSIQI